MRQYANYEFVRKLLQGYAKVNGLVVQLKSDALKERHWKTLCRQLRVNWVLSDLNLGQVWDVDLQKNEPVIRDVISVAQGEMALEEFLKQVINLIWRNHIFGDDPVIKGAGTVHRYTFITLWPCS